MGAGLKPSKDHYLQIFFITITFNGAKPKTYCDKVQWNRNDRIEVIKDAIGEEIKCRISEVLEHSCKANGRLRCKPDGCRRVTVANCESLRAPLER